jgi:hypothetical protein
MPAKKYTLWFNPTSDITAFELASILLTVPFGNGKAPVAETGITATEDEWKRVPPPLRKYFTKNSPWGPKSAETVVNGYGDTKEEAQVVSVAPQTSPMDNFVQETAPQPQQTARSFYGDDVSSLYPEGMEIIPTPEK